jgi:hypothetical protein
MAFHSKGGSISRSTRTNRRDKESILGLSGWLFADLLLAIAVIFLVVQDKPSVDPGEVTAENVAILKAQVADLKAKVAELETTLAEFNTQPQPAEESGLIASDDEILTIRIPNGASARSDEAFKLSLDKSSLTLGKQPTTFEQLQTKNYKIGFVIWFANTQKLSTKTVERYMGTFVTSLNEKELILDNQFDPKKPGIFPYLDYQFRNIGNDLFLRVFLFKSTE